MKILVRFVPGARNDIFEGTRLRKCIKGGLELNNIKWVESIFAEPDVCHFLSPIDEAKAHEAKAEGYPVVVSALYAESDPYCRYLERSPENFYSLPQKSLKMLNEATIERTTGQKVEPPKPMKLFKIDAYIPVDYASKEDKIELYQEIDACKTEADLKRINKRIRDIYGKLPTEVNLLIKEKRLDILMNNEEFDKVNDYQTNVEIVLSKKFSNISGIGNVLFDVLKDYMDIIAVSYINKTLKIRMQKEDDWMKSFETILNCIHDIYIEYKK